MTRAETIEKLLDVAFSALQHDTDDSEPSHVYGRNLLRRQFNEILDAAGSKPSIRGHEGQEHYGDGWEAYRPEGYGK